MPEPRRLALTRAADIVLRRPVWLWDTAPAGSRPQASEGRIPLGSVTIAAGMAGIGKSQFSCWAAGQLTRGSLPGHHYGTPKSVIIAANEDSWEMTIGPRLVAVGADMNRVFRVDVVDDGDAHARLSLPTDVTELARLIPTHDVALLVCDPLLSVLSAEINDYRGKEVRTALEPLVSMADQTRCSVIGLAHFNKAPSGDPLLAIQGAAAFGQLVRAAIGFARDDADREDPDGPETFVLSTTKNNLGRDNLPSLSYRIAPTSVDTADGLAWVSRFEFTGEQSTRSVRDIMRDGQSAGADRSEDRRSIDTWLIDYLTPMNRKATAVYSAADAAGYSKDQVKRAKKRLGIEARHPDLEGPWFWALPTSEQLASEGSNTQTHAPLHPLGAPLALVRDCGHPGAATERCGPCYAEAANRKLSGGAA